MKAEQNVWDDCTGDEYEAADLSDDNASTLMCSIASLETIDDEDEYLELKLHSFPCGQKMLGKTPDEVEETGAGELDLGATSRIPTPPPLPLHLPCHLSVDITAINQVSICAVPAADLLPDLWSTYWPAIDPSSNWYGAHPTDPRSWQPFFKDHHSSQTDLTNALCAVFSLVPEEAACWVNLVGLRLRQWYERVALFPLTERVLDVQAVGPSQQVRVVIQWVLAIGALRDETGDDQGKGTAGDLKVGDILEKCYFEAVFAQDQGMESCAAAHLNAVILGLQILDIWGIFHPLTPICQWSSLNLPLDLMTEKYTSSPSSTDATILISQIPVLLHLKLSSLAITADSSIQNGGPATFSLDRGSKFDGSGLDIGSLTEAGNFKIVFTPYANEHLLLRAHNVFEDRKPNDQTDWELLVYWFSPRESVLDGVAQKLRKGGLHRDISIAGEIRQTMRMLFPYKCNSGYAMRGLMDYVIALNKIQVPEWICCQPQTKITATVFGRQKKEEKSAWTLSDAVACKGCRRFEELFDEVGCLIPCKPYSMFPHFGKRIRALRYHMDSVEPATRLARGWRDTLHVLEGWCFCAQRNK